MDQKTILLVEDNADDEALTLRAIRKHNIASEVMVARDGAEALEYLFAEGRYVGRVEAHDPTVVLLDLKLPKVDGIEVLRRARTHPRTRLLPVVVLTSSKEDQDILNSYSSGANSYIRKPVDYDKFMAAVGSLGMYWLLLNERPPRTERRT